MKNIGGQAVIEGVMMKGRKGWTVAVRDPKGNIHIKREYLSELPKIFKLPIIRGVIALFHAISIGIKAIEFSANKAYDGGGKMSPFAIGLTIAFSFILGIALFILIPLYITKLLGLLYIPITKNSFLFNIADGSIRILIFLIYIGSIGMWKEMKRIFEYHGAEHKVIHAYEKGKALTIKNIKEYSPLHPRCGTSFLLIVMITSIFAFSFIPQNWTFLYKSLSRVILIPLIAGLSFEFLKLSSKGRENSIIHLLIKPGLLLQKITTREPDENQIEVAIRALEEVLRIEGNNA